MVVQRNCSGDPGYDATKDNTVCDPPLNGNPGKGDAQYVPVPAQNGGVTIASFGVNSGPDPITCGGWVCRASDGSSKTSLAQNAFMEGGIDLAAAGFHGCINTFLPHTRTSASFTAVLKDFAGPIDFSNCKSPTITTTQSSPNVTPASSITVGIGSSVTDTATLHGTAPVVGGTVAYKLYSDANCTQLLADGGTKTVAGTTNDGEFTLPASDPVLVNTAGTYYWQAAYSGDVAAGGANQPVTSGCGDEVLTVVAPSLSITKVADAATVSAGDPIGFTITVSNSGAGSATGVTLNDPLPTGAGVSWSISPANPACSINANTLSCNFGTLAGNGGSASVHVTSPTTFASCKAYPNTATASATNAGSVQASASITVNCPSLSITKVADAGTVSAGTNIGFLITVHNAGPGTAHAVTLNDPLPTGPGIAWSINPANAACNITTNTLSCNFGDVASGASVSVHVVSPTVFASCATYDNTATAQATNHAAVQASASITVQCPGLHITKVADATTVNVGEAIGFTIGVSNSGPGTATGVTLTDPLPAGTGVSWSISPANPSCSIAGSAPNQTLNCNFGDLASGASASVHVTSATANVSCGTYPNTATAQATNSGSVQATAGIIVNCPNLSITKVADAASVSAGTNIGFTITVSNAGPGTAKSVTLNDPLPTGAGINWTISPANPLCNIAAGILSCNFGDMAAGGSASVHVTSTTGAATDCKVYPNTASAQATNAPQVQASASTTVLCPALQVVKTADAPNVNAGDAIGFTVTVSNTGSGTATAVTLTDLLPGGPGISWSISPAYGGPGTCSVTGSAPNQTLGCAFGDLAQNASATVHVTSTTTFASCATYNNTAIASATNTGSAQASAATTVNCPNLSITKVADASSVSRGSPIGFSITVLNAGPGTAKSVSLNDPLPTGAGISWSINPPNAACNINSNTLSCNFGDMAPGATASVHVTSPTTSATPCQEYPNTATASATNHAPVQASATESVQCPGLNISKAADAPSVNAGDPIGFTITVSNTGAGTATGVTLNDPLPTGAGVSWSINPPNAACNINNNTLSCNFGDMAPGASATVHVTSATTFASCQDYPNTATASETNGGSVESSASITVNCPALTLTKTADNATVNAGEAIGFTVTVQNNGQGTAKAVTIVDPLPTGSGVSWTINPPNAACNINNNTLSCNFGDMAPGASATVHVTSPTSFASCGTYPNTAGLAAANHPSLNAQASTTVECPALSIAKTADASPVNTGDPIGFTVTVSNSAAAGTGTAKSVTLADPLPPGNGVNWAISPAYAGAGTCSITGAVGSQVLSCAFGDMAPGASNSVHILSATTTNSAGTYPNTATASATNAPSVQASAEIVVLAPSLSIVKLADASPVNTGDQIGFSITVSNSGAPGTGTAKSVTLSDPLPAGNGVNWSIGTAPAGCAITGAVGSQTLSCTLGDMSPGASVSIHIVSATTKDSAGTYPNTATASATNAPSVQASAEIVVLAPSLAIVKVADAATVNAGEAVGFGITVTNGGPGVARSVTIHDPIPAGPGMAWAISPAYAGPGSCSIAANTLDCSLGDLASGAQVNVHVSSATTGASCGPYNNTATAAATNDGSHEASASTTVNCPTLSLTKVADNQTVSAGDDIGFLITVHNAGPGTASAVTLNDPLPAGSGVSWSVNPANAACNIAAGTLGCNFGSLASGASASVHVTSATAFESCATYPNTATVSASNAPSLEASASTTVDCPDLSITKTADASPVNTGDPIGFMITVSNADDENTGTAHNVVLNDPLPAGGGVDWNIDTAPAGCSITGAVGSQVLHCDLGDMGPGATAAVHIVSATTAASGGTYPNTATATADNHDPVDATATIVVLPPALSITKTADAPQVDAGEPIGFTVTVANSDAEGTGIARSVTLSDPLPGHDGVDWSISPDYTGPGTCSISGSAPNQTLSCAFGDMAPGDSASVHVSSDTTSASVASYPNTATASTTNGGSVHDSAEISVIEVTPITAAATTTTTVVPALPRTGSNSGGLTVVAVALLVGGGALAASRRRRIRTARR